MSTRLAVYFLAQSDSLRVLDAEHPPSCGYWAVGRSPTCDIVFRLGPVSKQHAKIMAAIDKEATVLEGEPMYLWVVLDLISTNGTYIESSGDNLYRCAPNVPYEIKDRTRIQFGCQAAMVRCSFDVDDTMSQNDGDSDDGVSTGLQAHGRREEKRPTDDAPPETMFSLAADWGPAFWDWFKALPQVIQLVVLAGLVAAGVVVVVAIWGN